MLDLSGDDLRRKKMSRGKGTLSVLSYFLPTPLALIIFAIILAVLLVAFWLSL